MFFTSPTLRQRAWKEYKELAQRNIPRGAKEHDGGQTWMDLHKASFKETNPPPAVAGFSEPQYTLKWHDKYKSYKFKKRTDMGARAELFSDPIKNTHDLNEWKGSALL